MNKLKKWYEEIKSSEKWVWGFLVGILIVVAVATMACDVETKMSGVLYDGEITDRDKARNECNKLMVKISDRYDISPEPGWEFCDQIGRFNIFNEVPEPQPANPPEPVEPSPPADQ